MWVNYKREFFQPKTIYIMIFYFFISMATLTFFNSILSEREMIYSVLEFLVVAFGLAFTIIYFKNIRSAFFRKQLKVSDKLNRFFFTYLLVIFSYLFLLVAIYFLTFFVLSYTNFLNFENFINGDYIPGSELPSSINWFSGENKMLYYWIAISLEVLMVILYGIILILIFKNYSLLMLSVILIILYTLFFGNILNNYVSFSNLDGTIDNYVFTADPDFYSFKAQLNIFLLPWNQIGIIANHAFMIGSNKELYSFSDYSQLGFYSILKYLPFIYIFVMSLIISISIWTVK